MIFDALLQTLLDVLLYLGVLCGISFALFGAWVAAVVFEDRQVKRYREEIQPAEPVKHHAAIGGVDRDFHQRAS